MKKRFFIAIAASCLFGVLFICLRATSDEAIADEIKTLETKLYSAAEELKNEKIDQDRLYDLQAEVRFVKRWAQLMEEEHQDKEISATEGDDIIVKDEFDRIAKRASELQDEIVTLLEDLGEGDVRPSRQDGKWLEEIDVEDVDMEVE